MNNLQEKITQRIEQLSLQPHAEGGYFKETNRGDIVIKTTAGKEHANYSNILFLLAEGQPSHFHRLQSDEVWYFHEGSPLSIHCLYPDGTYEVVKLGNHLAEGEQLQFVVPKNTIFGSSVESGYALVSCMVSPSFDYEEFELFTQAELLKIYPNHQEIIKKLAYEALPDEIN